MDLCELSPAYVRAIAPYQPGKPITEVAREFGLDQRSIVKLASNENPRGVSPKALAAIEAALPELARYPDGFELTQALSERLGVPMQQIVLGNGSNDVLELAGMAFLAPGCSAVYSQHAFAVYPLATQRQHIAPGVTAACIAMTGGAAGAMCLALRAFLDAGDEVVGIAPYFPEFRPYCETGGLSFNPVRADDTSQRVDIDALVRALSDRTAALIINTPSNPSGHVIEHDEMAAIVDVLEHHNRRTGRRILLIADEAYRNLVYAPARRVEPFAYYEHTVLARSFSKDMGLAGERIGYLALHPSLAGEQTDRGLESCMRALGMVNAPATAQRAALPRLVEHRRRAVPSTT